MLYTKLLFLAAIATVERISASSISEPYSCKRGYAYNDSNVCVDVNECTETPYVCSGNNSICENTDGSFNCSCKSGYTPKFSEAVGDAPANLTSCDDIDECKLNISTCPANRYCVNNDGSYTCICKPGYTHVNNTCEDIDECAHGVANCPASADCVNNDGSYTCRCKPGYTLVNNTCIDIDECALGVATCPASADCVNNDGSYTCRCKRGYTLVNKTCTDVNECTETPYICSGENSICENTDGSFKCSCKPGYTPKFSKAVGDAPANLTSCDDIDECKLNISTCPANRYCVNNDGSYTCKCKPGYTLVNNTCEDIDECALGVATCPASADCVNNNGSYTCRCKRGFTLVNNTCKDIDECALGVATCPASADCVNNDGSYTCRCKRGYTLVNKTCTDVNECTETPYVCSGENSICENTDGSFKCSCKPGYTPKFSKAVGDAPANLTSCDDIDECKLNISTCPANRYCVNNDGSYTCKCKPGYTLVNNTCEDINECALGVANCPASADCVNNNGSYTCRCKPGFTLVNNTCKDIDECALGVATCPASADCVNNDGSYTCRCKRGYTLVNKTCTDVNECTETPYVCSGENSICENTDGSFKCSCKPGYTPKFSKAVGDAPANLTSCDDIDECKLNISTCPANRYCVNNDGSYTCKCKPGYTLVNNTCEDIDECALGVANCPASADCVNNDGSYTCRCKRGFTLVNNTCKDTDECALGVATCPASADCVNNDGSYTCRCKRGYTLVNKTCKDIDECALGVATCPASADCVNNNGSYTCRCKRGFTLVNNTCKDIDECALGVATCPASADCVNNDGSYTCRCKRGYTLVNKTCTDVNECTETPYVCSGENSICENTDGSFKCSCKPGYTPKFSKAVGDAPANLTSCDDIDECKLNISTCPANRYCVNNDGSYTCKCKPGYTLVNNTCEDINECALGVANCPASADCVNNNGSYTCRCKPGFTLVNNTCKDIDECALGVATCPASADCVNNDGSYTCRCKRGYTLVNKTCTDVNECTETPYVCSGENSICENTDGSFKCSCKPGYTPKFSKAVGDAPANLTSCDDIDECKLNISTCPANRYCVNNDGSYTCKCKPGYTLVNNTCEDIDECALGVANCPASADCVNNDGSYTCRCKRGFTLVNNTCKDTDECALGVATCPASADCVNNDGSYTCRCKRGYTLVNKTCKDIDECALGVATCPASADCVNNNGSYTCRCKRGFTLVNNTCKDIDECALGVATCPASADCVNNDGSYTCRCKRGYTLVNNTCEDIDECALGVANCPASADCFNYDGSYTCRCKRGYTLVNKTCTDIDECALGVATCPASADCVNNDGSYTCKCKPGYTLVNNTCEDIDECALGVANCPASADCFNYDGSYTCRCKRGYTLVNKTCTDIDECALGVATCPASADCVNNDGSYTCKCKPGYTLVNNTCEDIDECALGVANCPASADCFNYDGSYTCRCKRGYTLVNKTCTDIDECALGVATCPASADCVNNDGSYTCRCKRGYTLVNKTCTDVNECTETPYVCSGENSICENTDGSFKCSCKPGYTPKFSKAVGDAPANLTSCDDIDECKLNISTCPANRYCVNNDGSYTCKCKPGYTLVNNTCEDIDECALGVATCPASADCVNNDGSYTCRCKRGYTLKNNECEDVNECLDLFLNTCLFKGLDCINLPGSFQCKCPAGQKWDPDSFYGIGGCVDLNECVETPYVCSGDNSICQNTEGSFTCSCKPGYTPTFSGPVSDRTRNLTSCDDVNECARDPSPCHENAACTNTKGSYLCRCNSGYTGDGKDCKPKRMFDLNRPRYVYCERKRRYENRARCPGGFNFFGKRHNHLWINCNGMMSVERHHFRKTPKDLTRKSHGKDIIFPFWADVDYSRYATALDVQFQELAKGDEDSSELLGKINKMVNESTDLGDDFASCAIIVTWKDTSPRYRYNSWNPYRDQKNTFQSALVSNGDTTVIMFLYAKDQMGWLADHGFKASMGWARSDGEYYQFSKSFTDDILRIDSHSFEDPQGNKREGVFIKVLGERLEPTPASICSQWVLSERRRGTFWYPRWNCPCSLWSVRRQFSFQIWGLNQGPDWWFQGTGRDWQGDVACYSFRPFLRGPNKACCYSRRGRDRGALITGSSLRAGRVCRYSPFVEADEYWREMKMLDTCCRESTEYCSDYLAIRPAETVCTLPPWWLRWGPRPRIRRPRRTFFWGDPHITTVDGFGYSFNGLGDYVMMKSTNSHRIHTRTARPLASNGALAKATVFSGFALAANGSNVVQVMYDTSVSGNMSITVTNSTSCSHMTVDQLSANAPAVYTGLALTRKNATVVVIFDSGLTCEISPGVESIQMALTVPVEFENTTQGLMGKMNENKEDDLAFPNGTMIPVNSDEKKIFEFGQTWRVPNSDRLFVFSNCSKQPVFFDEAFEPVFLSDLNITDKMREACGNDKGCLLDYAATGNKELAVSGKSYREENLKAQEDLDNLPPEIDCDSILNATIGEQVTFKVTTSDPNNDKVTLQASQMPEGAMFNNKTGLTWKPLPSNNKSAMVLEFVATDEKGATAVQAVTIALCDCKNNGTCDFDTVLSVNNASKLRTVGCNCSEQYTGDFCENEPDPCLDEPCYEGVTCTRDKSEELGYTCGACPSGRTGDGVSCADINECADPADNNCPQECENTLGGYKCKCRPGYISSNNGRICTDINECDPILGSNDCGANTDCTNGPGNYSCTCKPGYKGDPKVKCEDINECNYPNDCSQMCSNTAGSYKCSCVNGFVLSNDLKTCADINECATPVTNDCEMICINARSSYKCACPTGFILNSDKKTCSVANSSKCDSTNGGCSHACTNSSGIVGCFCDKGYVLDSGNKTCKDIDECAEKTSGCGQRCKNLAGSYECSCDPGYELNADKITCKDIDECSRKTHKCSDSCLNTVGFYNCGCPPGYKLMSDEKTCQDVDECENAAQLCPPDMGLQCMNTKGSYVCSCPPGRFAKKKKSGWMKCKDSKRFKLSRRFNKYRTTDLKFNDKLKDKGSDEFKKLAEMIENILEEFFLRLLKESVECVVVAFRDGSVIADMELHTAANSSLSIDDMNNALSNSSSMGEFSSDPSYGKVEDFNECLNNSDNDCHEHATCTNTAGSFTCACAKGYSGDGKACEPVPVPGESGLSTKELIAIIVCACIAGLILLSIMIWCCCFRNRVSKILDEREFNEFATYKRIALQKHNVRPYGFPGGGDPDNMYLPQEDDDEMIGSYDVEGATFDNSGYKKDTPM
ncbi:fibrillin-1 isoform X2 [Nematostella vectensis]|uniref:fibrillin-1 isoform X2 n=1 Tax=Nematostella vectensis TaxID=45351 RepID=UPI00207775AD|nr:fibrillin-1 isoform X2 [Nematostella vectensis]